VDPPSRPFLSLSLLSPTVIVTAAQPPTSLRLVRDDQTDAAGRMPTPLLCRRSVAPPVILGADDLSLGGLDARLIAGHGMPGPLSPCNRRHHAAAANQACT
jgi:hypothetical protein